MNLCQDIFDKATQNQDAFPTGTLFSFLNYLGADTVRGYLTNVKNTASAYENLADILREKIGVDPEDDTIATDDDGNNILDDAGNAIPE